MYPPRANNEHEVRAVYTVPPRLTLPSKQRISYQRDCLAPATERSISNLDTVLTVAIELGERQPQQKGMLLEALVEDIASQITLQLPIIRLTSAKQSESDKHHIIVSTAGNAALAGIGNLINAALRYATNVIMTNTVSQVIFGTFVTVSTTASVVGTVAMLGLDSTMLRFLSAYRARSEHDLTAGLIRFVIWMTLISGLLFGTLFYFSSTTIAHLVYHQDTYALPLKEVSLLIPLIALQLVLASGLQALKAIKWKIYVALIQPGLSLILIVVFYLLGLRFEALILATICGFLASAITGQILLGKATGAYICNAVPRMESKKWLRFALPMSLNSIIQNVLNSTDVLFLTAFAASAQVGLYAAADRVSLLILMPSFALNVIFSPLIGEYYARGELEQLASLSKLVTKWSFSLCWPLCLCFCIFHVAILGIFSREYTAGGMALIILSIGNLIGTGVSVTGSLLMMTGKTRVLLVNSVAIFAVNIGLAFWLVPYFNVIGTAVATSLTVIILNFTAFIEVYWLLKIVTLRWDMLKSVAAGGIASVVGLLLLRVIHVGYGYQAIIGVLAMIISFMLVYIAVLALLRFSKEDITVFDAIHAKFSKKPSV